jgi:hypothetical protein
MRTFMLVLALLGTCCVIEPASAAQSDDCKLCREDYRACVKNHSQAACKTGQGICLKHCSKK